MKKLLNKIGILTIGAMILLQPGCASLGRRKEAHRPSERAYVQEGMASWYGGRFHGRRTASGERYNMHALTCAHPTLPFGTKVRVTNLDNGKDVILKVNDRGPYIHPRVLDVSKQAALELNFIGQGTALVRIEKIDL